MLVAIWALRPSVRRAIAVGIPVYVAAVFLLITPLPLATVLLLVIVVILVGLLYWFGM